MSERKINATGCEVSISHITGDIVCQRPGPDCDCLIVAEPNEIEQEAMDLALNDCQMWANLPESARDFYRREAREETHHA